MNEPNAIVLASIAGALVSGAVAVASSAVSLRAAHRQLEQQAEDNQRDRRHQVYMAVLQRRHSALEAVWELLFLLEREGHLSDRQTELFIRSVMWIPAGLQSACVELLQSLDQRSQEKFAAARKALMEQASTTELT